MKRSSLFPVNSHFILLMISVTLNVGLCIMDGNITVEGDFKYHVFLKNKAFTSCSGIVIDEWHILTAAHCIYRNTPSQVSVYAGAIVLRRGITEIYEVHSIHIHKDYQISRDSVLDMKSTPWPYHRANDIAILTLETPLLLGSHIEGVQLSTEAVIPFSSSKCLIVGWDLVALEDSSILFVHRSWIEVIITPPAYCQVFGISIRGNELCVSEPFGETSVNYVDTGGGLLCDGVLVGVILSTDRNANRPTVHANIHHFLDFINQIKREDRELYCSLPYMSWDEI